MAGIGFELRKVAGKSGIGSFFKIALSGAVIVAGPWLLSIITIFFVRILTESVFGKDLDLFMGVIIYCYAFSLFLFGGFHYLFTRRMSDLLYLKRENEAFGYVLRLCIPVCLVSAAIAVPAVMIFKLDIEHQALFRISSVLFFMTINCLWIVMLFVSVLKWYIKIMFVYAAGSLLSLLLIYLLAAPMGLAGSMLGFSGGHLLIVILLIILCRTAWKPQKSSSSDTFIRYIAKHRFLFGAGLLYYWGIWIDKIIYWVSRGETVPGTFINLYETYDIPVFLANLSMIPGLIFFVIFSETEYYTALKHFLLKIAKGRYAEIITAKLHLNSITSKSIREQSIPQAVVTTVMVLFAGGPVLKVTLVAVFFHLLLLSMLNYLFYIEQYRHAFIASIIFFLANALFAVISVFTQSGALIPGTSYAIGAATAAFIARILLKRDILKLERYILTKN